MDGRGKIMRNNNITILGTGSYLPSNIVTNEQLCKHIDTTPEWVENKFGPYKDWSLHKISLDWR